MDSNLITLAGVGVFILGIVSLHVRYRGRTRRSRRDDGADCDLSGGGDTDGGDCGGGSDGGGGD
ncbi:MAG: hypothetical protein LCH74_02600 [Proteobacteria bacterium]|nr:hypothetical protein [Pseudomonadota bacterium]